MSSMSKQICLKGTPYACPCDRCMSEAHQRAEAHFAHLAQLKSGTANYWTSQYSARDKAHTVIILQAGFDHQQECDCLFCQVEYESSH